MRIFVTGGTGVLGRGLIPLLEADGHGVSAPGSGELDLFDGDAVAAAVAAARPEAIYHLATRVPTGEAAKRPGAFEMNDRLRAEALPLLARAATDAGVGRFVLPTLSFVYPDGPADESTPPRDDANPAALVAERAVARYTEAGGTGVVLRLGLLWGPGTGNDRPQRMYGTTLEVGAAARALLAALGAPAGLYNVTDEGDRVSSERFRRATGWRP